MPAVVWKVKLAHGRKFQQTRTFCACVRVQVTQDYYFFIHGVPKELWDALPLKLTEKRQRPTGGVQLQFLSHHLVPGQDTQGPLENGAFYSDDTPPLLKLLAVFKQQLCKNPGLKICANALR